MEIFGKAFGMRAEINNEFALILTYRFGFRFPINILLGQ